MSLDPTSWRSPLEQRVAAQTSNFKARSVIVKVWIKSTEGQGAGAESIRLVPEPGNRCLAHPPMGQYGYAVGVRKQTFPKHKVFICRVLTEISQL